MKLANHGGRATLVGPAGRAVDVAKASGGRFGPEIQPLYDDWEAFRAFSAEVDTGEERADVTVDEARLQFAAGNQFSLGKSFPRYGPIGPWLVTPDELDDPDDLALGCAVDGETVQEARTGDLIFGVPRLVAELSAIVAMLPGDVIFTGTPAGVGFTRQPPRFLQPGETVESWVTGIGTIRNRFVSGGR
jgi:hypothetical protein